MARDLLTNREFALLRDRLAEETGLSLKEDKRKVLEEAILERLKAFYPSIVTPPFNSPSYLKRGEGGVDNLEKYLREYIDLLIKKGSDGVSNSIGGAINSRGELTLLASHISNKETYFFREMPQLEVSMELLRDMLKNRDSLKVLCLGCSTGEEVYTLSILIHEKGLLFPSKEIKLTGIDIDQRAIRKAIEGRYTANSLRSKDIPVDKYFIRDERFFRIKDPYKRIVEFRQGNILDSNTFVEFLNVDMVFCRNVFIYMTEEAILKVLKNIHRVLCKKGYLIIGSAESITYRTDLFEPVHYNSIVVYRKV
jgi:chemotaxis protein methyltransferase CheR